jgi:superfamily II DNA or RNA helicase
MRNKKLLDLFKNHIGSIVLDEAHIVSAKKISTAVQFFPAKYRLALSATPTRSDGLEEMIYDIFSNNIVKAKNPDSLGVKIQRVMLNEKFYFSSLALYKKELAEFLTRSSLKRQIVQLAQELLQSRRTILVAINIIEVQREYQRLLNKLDENVIIFNGSVSQNERDEILKNIELGKHKIIIGFNVLEKGISIPRLDTIIHLSGASTKEKTQQLIGRLTREHEEKKEPLFIEVLFGGDLERKEQTRMNTYMEMVKSGEKIVLPVGKLDAMGPVISVGSG